MPYELSFSKLVTPPEDYGYFNDCCFGGDVVSDQLLPGISKRYARIQHNQEDWGWFIWITEPKVSLAVDIYCDDPLRGKFRIHLTSSERQMLILDRVRDLPELDELKDLVLSQLNGWIHDVCTVKRIAS